MNNETQRKITSLTLMTIMLAGGMTFAIPGVLPEAQAANPNLVVSAENSSLDNTFAGPMVVQVLITDQDYSETDEAEGEPSVTVNGDDLRMVQATDGNWYAYFAEKRMAAAADATVDLLPVTTGEGLDFGTLCTPVQAEALTPGSFSAVGVYTPNDCANGTADNMNVIRSEKTINFSQDGGQIGLTNVKAWPFIQVFDFSVKGEVEIIYNAAGNDQKVELYYTDDNSNQVSLDLDRGAYPQSANVHFTITDQMLNIDPTSEDVWTFNATNSQATYYDSLGTPSDKDITLALSSMNYEDNGILIIDADSGKGIDNIVAVGNDDHEFNPDADNALNFQVTVVESSTNSNVFENFDNGNNANVQSASDALRGTTAKINYNDDNQSILIDNFDADVEIQAPEDEWTSGQEIDVLITDQDTNKNTKISEDIEIGNPNQIIPTIKIGSPITLALSTNSTDDNTDGFSDRFIANLTDTNVLNSTGYMKFKYDISYKDFLGFVDADDIGDNYVFSFVNYDFESTLATDIELYIANKTSQNLIFESGSLSGLENLDDKSITIPSDVNESDDLVLIVKLIAADDSIQDAPVILDFLRFGVDDNNRYNDAIYRMLAEETTVSSGIFKGSIEYVMLNQINAGLVDTYEDIETSGDSIVMIAHEDLSDEDSIRVNYYDLSGTGKLKNISDQEEAPSHSGTVGLDSTNYKVGDTVTVTVYDTDLNTDTDTLEIYTIPTNLDVVGNEKLIDDGEGLGQILRVTFDDKSWERNGECTGFEESGFTLAETLKGSGIFVGTFEIPKEYCVDSEVISVSGLDIGVDYIDFRDASGEEIEVSDSAGVGANTGSISLDKTVYSVPFGVPDNFESILSHQPDNRSVFPIHQSGMNDDGDNTKGLDKGEYLENGDLVIHLRVNDPDFDLAASGEDAISEYVRNGNAYQDVGPVKISVTRGSESVILGYAGSPSELDGVIQTSENIGSGTPDIRQFGPITEIAPDAGIFEADITIRYTDGPASPTCPETLEYENIGGGSDTDVVDRFDDNRDTNDGDYCILQGDILTVEYTDPTDASGSVNTVTDSATFDLRNGVLQSDKSVYIIGSDMILTLIEPDFDLDSDQAETYNLDVVEWDSDAGTLSMGKAGDSDGVFDPEPSNFRETGDSTGIFQIVIEIPEELDGDNLERGEQIDLEYTDWGPSGSDFVGDEDEDVQVTIFTSNFGATIELDQKVYTWTDKIYITIVAPDHNFDGDLVDEIGESEKDPIKIATRGNDLDNYKLVETGTDTGIFTGEVILTGFAHDADGDKSTGDKDGYDTSPRTSGSGPTNGFLEADDDDGLTISFEFSEDDSVVGSALIRWNIGEVQWLEASYPASGTGVVRVIDPDMNLDPEAVDNFGVDVWSDSDAGGIDLTVTETNEATGIFEGTVFFTTTNESSGHRLRVAEGDTVTAEYEDNTLPDPYTTADELDITATTLIGTIVPPLERAPAANLRTVDAFGNSLDTVSVDQQVQISADLSNGQDRVQEFAYLVQIQDGNGVTVSLAWITGSLTEGQSFSPALSWVPTTSGSYTATAFVWESVDNPTALSPPVSTTINVS